MVSAVWGLEARRRISRSLSGLLCSTAGRGNESIASSIPPLAPIMYSLSYAFHGTVSVVGSASSEPTASWEKILFRCHELPRPSSLSHRPLYSSARSEWDRRGTMPVDPPRRPASSSAASAHPDEASSPPEGEGLRLANRAIERLKQLQTDAGDSPVYLRLSVQGGGCSGFQYEFSLEEQSPLEDDAVFVQDGVSVICDSVSLEFLKGATVDFESDLIRSGFVVHENPNASTSCGCGSSFAAK